MGSAGLSAAEAARRLAEFGPNELRQAAEIPAWRVLARQFVSPMVALLAVAAAVSLALREVADAVAIATILALNAVVGFVQEHRAERALLALRSMTAPRGRVRREGRASVVPAREVVPGDLLLLEPGDVVAADGVLREAHELSAVEAPLTGESVPVSKGTQPTSPGAPLAERTDRIFMGTAIATGAGVAEVTGTGMATEMGRIAGLLETAERGATPLQVQLAQVGRTLIGACLAVVALVFGLGLLRGQDPLEVLLLSVSLAVAAVPEGLPAIVTIALAVGVQRMARRHALVRRLAAVETLGSATVICTDKTGTLTAGSMAVREIWGRDEDRVLDAAAACCDAELGPEGRDGTGDPTEIAVLAAAWKRGIRREAIEAERPRLEVHPFDTARRRMSIHRGDGRLYVKGALESVLPLCSRGTEGVEEANRALATRGLRVLAVALGEGPLEGDLELAGLVGLADPPRPEAIDAVAAARRAGIATVMITGDHPDTARAIAREMGILGEGEDPGERVHARATPEDKIRIVREWKDRGAVVAMTGDGVNDAPALREAHIGVAMGRTGTEVTREAADLVLTDDNYATIVAAVREGRAIHGNIRKTLVYLLTGNAAELSLMLGTALVALPSPLVPIHLLWINLVTDGLPALSLVVDPPDPDVLRRPPRPPGEPMLGRPQWRAVAAVGVLEAVLVGAVFALALPRYGLDLARTLAFDTLVASELLRAFAARSPHRIFWEVGALTNLALLGVIGISMLLQAALHAWEPTRELFRLVPLSPEQALLCVALGLIPVSAVELWKLGARWAGRPAREA